jgi:uncharacterized protein
VTDISGPAIQIPPSPAISRLRLLFVVGAALLLAGCAGLRSYQSELNRTLDLARVGEPGRALETFEKFNRRSKDSLLYHMERGELLRLAGRYQDSQQAWFEADAHVQKWEDAALANPERLFGGAMSLLVNDASRPYEGEDYEKVMLTTRIALNHLVLGEWDKARVAIRRTHEREALVARLRERQVRKLEEEGGERARRSFRELDGYPVQTIDSPEVNALRNSYQSAFSHYLAGFVYEALGEPSLAAAGYRQAIELQPGAPLLDQALEGLDARVFDRDSGRSELLVVIESGAAPARSSVNINLPVPTDAGFLLVPMSFPTIRDEPRTMTARSVSIDGSGTSNIATLTSVDLMARRALRDEMPSIMLRAIARATTKAVLQRQAMKRDDTGLAGALAIIGTIVTERADERAWRTLPAEIAARASVAPGTHRLEIEADGTRHAFEVNVEGRYALIAVRLLGGRAYLAAEPVPAGQQVQSEARRIGLR